MQSLVQESKSHSLPATSLVAACARNLYRILRIPNSSSFLSSPPSSSEPPSSCHCPRCYSPRCCRCLLCGVLYNLFFLLPSSSFLPCFLSSFWLCIYLLLVYQIIIYYTMYIWYVYCQLCSVLDCCMFCAWNHRKNLGGQEHCIPCGVLACIITRAFHVGARGTTQDRKLCQWVCALSNAWGPVQCTSFCLAQCPSQSLPIAATLLQYDLFLFFPRQIQESQNRKLLRPSAPKGANWGLASTNAWYKSVRLTQSTKGSWTGNADHHSTF